MPTVTVYQIRFYDIRNDEFTKSRRMATTEGAKRMHGEATLIFPNMRSGCATIGNTVHTLFRVNGRRPGVATLEKVPDVLKPDALPVEVNTRDVTLCHTSRTGAA